VFLRKINLFFRQVFPVYIVFAAIGGAAKFFARRTNSIKRSEVNLLEKKNVIKPSKRFSRRFIFRFERGKQQSVCTVLADSGEN
jgi:hypothetical protein